MGLEHSSVWELSFHGMEDPPKSEFNNLCLYARFEQAKIRERSERDVRREELANCIQRALSTFTRLREHITYVILLLHCTFGFGDRQLLLAWFVYVNMSGSFVVKTRTKAIHETQQNAMPFGTESVVVHGSAFHCCVTLGCLSMRFGRNDRFCECSCSR